MPACHSRVPRWQPTLGVDRPGLSNGIQKTLKAARSRMGDPSREAKAVSRDAPASSPFFGASQPTRTGK
jgi:hypothetical protein